MEVPYNIGNYRRELCDSCKTPCEFQKSAEYRAEGNNECPIGRWRAYKLFVRKKMKRIKGLGDAVELLAEPLAGALDLVLKTKIKGCGGCAKRREMLNKMLPFGS